MFKKSPLLLVSIISLCVSIIKLFAFIHTGALIILSSFFDSLVDSFVSFVNHNVYSASRKTPDKEHPFGHGGLEVISSVVQGTMILAFSIVLVIEALKRYMSWNFEQELHIDNIILGVAVLIIGALIGLFIQIYLTYTLKKLEQSGQRSLSILSDSIHYMGDFWHNFLSGVSLLIVWYTKLFILDSVVACVVAVILAKASYNLLRKSIKDILHEQGDIEIQKKIMEIIHNTLPQCEGVHMFRLRHFGPTVFVDFHLTLPSKITLEDANKIVMTIKRDIQKFIPYSDVMIHVDPDTLPEETIFSK